MKEVRTAGSRYMEECVSKDVTDWSTCPKGTHDRSGGLDVHSITLDFGSADRTGSVSLQTTKMGK